MKPNKKSDLEATMELSIRTSPGMPAPVLEYPFAKDVGRRWRFDFAWPEFKVALEIEGGTFVQGRHSRGRGMENDMEKYNIAAIAGWLVIRASGDMVMDERATNTLRTALLMRGAM